MGYTVYLIISFLLLSPCEVSENNAKIQQIVDLIKQRLNINTLECDFTVLSEYFYYPELCQQKTGKFAISGDSLFAYYPVEMSFKHNIRIKREKQAKNIFDLAQRLQGIETKIEVYQGFYIHQGTIEVRDFRPEISFRDDNFQVHNEKIEIRNWKHKWYDLGQIGDPRWLIGYVGLHLTSPNLNLPRRKVVKCLDTSGKILFYEKDNFRIFWKECFLENPNYEKLRIPEKEHVSFEIWLDDHNNIVKILEGIFPSRSYGQKTVEEILKKNGIMTDVNCNHPRYVRREFEFSDFKEFDGGVRIPTTGKITEFNLSIKKEAKYEYEKIQQRKDKNEISDIEFNTLFSLLVDPNDKMFENIIKIHPETLKVNQTVPEQTFIPPEPNIKQEENENNLKKSKWHELYKSAIFVLLFIIFIFIGVLITRKYLGWDN